MTLNGGNNWTQLVSGMPTIPIRDITIQRRENDLVAGSFGRGIFILDDISPLRDYETNRNSVAKLFPVKTVPWYRQSSRVGSQGDAEWIAKNPPFGANFTYFMREEIKSKKDIRKENEKKGAAKFPGWDALEQESTQDGPSILLVVKDANNNVVNTVEGTNKKGFNRVNWNLSYPTKSGERLQVPKDRSGFRRGGVMATPGAYSVTLVQRANGANTVLQGPESFNVAPIFEGALPRKPFEEMNSFREAAFAFQQDLTATTVALTTSQRTVDAMLRALNKATAPSDDLYNRLITTKKTMFAIEKELQGDKIKGEIGERSDPNASDGNSIGRRALGNTYGPTEEHKAFLSRVQSQLKQVKSKLQPLLDSSLPALESDLKKTGAPWVEGQGLIKD